MLSFFHLVEKADTDNFVDQHPIEIMLDNDPSLYGKVVDAGPKLIRQYYPKFESGTVPRIEQDGTRAT